MTQRLEKINSGLAQLAVFRSLLNDKVISSLQVFLNSEQAQRSETYCSLAAEVYAVGGNLGSYLLNLMHTSENPVAKSMAANVQPPQIMVESMERELQVFSLISQLNALELAVYVDVSQKLPLFENTEADFVAEYFHRLNNISTMGHGLLASGHMFAINETTQLEAVKNPDKQSLASLTGYEKERRRIIVNTEALLNGLPANNILLYGDAGTGKSSTVKALANEYKDMGLRLVAVRKNQLEQIPQLMETLSRNLLKFIIFIDDLSFSDICDEFTQLKAILEGDISQRPQNVVVYATSNRRNLVRESTIARLGGDVHATDSIEESQSLSARFGITVTFLKPDRELYEGIVENLAREYGLNAQGNELLQMAEAHALRSGGRSPRAAKQFVEFQKAVENSEQAKHTHANKGGYKTI